MFMGELSKVSRKLNKELISNLDLVHYSYVYRKFTISLIVLKLILL